MHTYISAQKYPHLYQCTVVDLTISVHHLSILAQLNLLHKYLYWCTESISTHGYYFGALIFLRKKNLLQGLLTSVHYCVHTVPLLSAHCYGTLHILVIEKPSQRNLHRYHCAPTYILTQLLILCTRISTHNNSPHK